MIFVSNRTVGLWVTLTMATILLSLALGLAVAEKMKWLGSSDIWIRQASKALARKRTFRNVYICFVVGIVFTATIVNMV